MSAVSNYIGGYGVKYTIEEQKNTDYILYCLSFETKAKEEVIKKQSFFKGSFDGCLAYLKTIEKQIESY